MTDEEILDLADRFCSPEQATAVLDAAEVPRRRRPRWRDNAVRFWFEVSELVAGGKVPGGRAGLLAAAARESPAGLFEPVPGRWAPSSPAALLLASREVVDFYGRPEELVDLRRWCEGGGNQVRLIVGPGGQGKTRLAMRLCAVMRSAGWDAGLLSEGAEEQVFDGAAGSDQPLLLVVDRVEARPTRLETILKRLVAPRLAAGAVVRVLLLTRSLSAGALWWDLTGASSPDVGITALVPEPLGALGPHVDRLDAYLVALHRFAGAWRAVEPDTDWGALAAGLPWPEDLAEPANGLTFTVHLRALTDLLQAGPRPIIDVGPRARAEDVLLGHEATYWRQAAAHHRLRQPESVARAAVAAAGLCGAQEADEAVAVLGGLPELAEVDLSARLAVAEWLRDLYPAQAGAYWGTLAPDRIAEHHLGSVLRERPDLAANLFTAASDGQLAHGLITLAQASDHQPHLPPILAGLLTDHPTIAPRAVRLDPTTLADLIGSLPDESVELAEAAATVVARATRDTNADTLPDLPLIFPRLLTTLTDRLIVLGRPEAALTAAREATRLFRLLDAAPPDAVTIVSVSPYDAARDMPVPRAREAAGELGSVFAVTPLAAVSPPGVLTAALADAVNTMSFLLAGLGRPAEALAAAEEAVAAYRRAAAVQPSGSRAELGLASALHNLSERLPDLGRLEEAVTADEEAVTILRRHDAARPGLFSASLAGALISLSDHLAALERHADAVEPAMAAMAINRRLAQEYPATSVLAFAASLTVAAVRLSEAGDRQKAISTAQEAVVVFHELYQRHPAEFVGRLTSTLTFTGQLLHGTGQTEATLQALVPALTLASDTQNKEMVPVILALLREERRHDGPAFDAAWTTIAGEPVPDGL
ncbi:effector-associated domain EAD1-containing protein [Parafrankia discariae]|uniref:effector-associated domain EAD1-containing protein n=1 Tax=Parafrankia discariae TaxID=365528 RepID=UPI00039B5082|nr:effector-associated domain EAD1-containing protein [Parafrankia discariae]